MLTELFTNAAETTLNGAINNSVTSVVVTDGSTFPAGNFRVLVDTEFMRCTSRSGNTLTVVRGTEGSTAASHLDLAAVNSILTAGSIAALKSDFMAMMGLGRVPTSGNTYGDEFDNESFSGWTAVVPGSPTITPIEQDNFASFLHPGGAAGIFHSYMKSCSARTSGDWISMCYTHLGAHNNYPQATLWFADGATYGAGSQVGFAFSPNENTFVVRGETNYNNQTSFDAGSGSVIEQMPTNYNMHMKLVYKGSNQYDAYFSPDGINWVKTHSNSGPTASFTPSYCGFGFTAWGSNRENVFTFRNFRSSF